MASTGSTTISHRNNHFSEHFCSVINLLSQCKPYSMYVVSAWKRFLGFGPVLLGVSAYNICQVAQLSLKPILCLLSYTIFLSQQKNCPKTAWKSKKFSSNGDTKVMNNPRLCTTLTLYMEINQSGPGSKSNSSSGLVDLLMISWIPGLRPKGLIHQKWTLPHLSAFFLICKNNF